MLSLHASLKSFCGQFQLNSLRTIRNFFSVMGMMLFPLAANALTVNIPSTDADGSYFIQWSGVRSYVILYELINNTPTAIGGDSSGSTSSTFEVKGKTPGIYKYIFKDCLVTGSQNGKTESCTETSYTVVVSPDQGSTGTGTGTAIATAMREISTNNYDIYFGDINADGKSDYYFNGKQQVILLHGDIVTPVTILPPPSFIIVRNSTGYINPQLFKMTPDQISEKISANTLRKAQLNSDYYIWTDGVSGQSKVLMRGSSITEPSTLLLSSATSQTPSIAQVFQPNSNANLSNYGLSIGFNDFNKDGRKDLDINGYTYLSNSGGSIDATPVIKTTPPSSVKVSLDFMTGAPWVTWPAVDNITQYDVREMINGAPTGSLKTVSATNAGFGVLVQLGTYTYEVRACKISNVVSNCSDWASSNGIKSKLNNAPLIDSPISNTSGVFNVSWSRVTAATRYELYENNVLIQNSNDLVKFFSGFNSKTSGAYIYQVRACKENVCGPLSNISTTTVSRGGNTGSSGVASTQIQKSSELTNGVVDSLPIMDAPTSLVGTTTGQFRVNESGAATYNIPIFLPDGIAGVTPQISLAYSSQGGQGLLGKGWSLSGLSEISRCRQTLAQDGQAVAISFSANDRFCLDGQRLMLIPGSGFYGQVGSRYKTEIDTYVIVTANGGTNGNPDYFTVEAKDGSVSTYGDSGSDASEIAMGANTFRWNIKTFKDNLNNPILYVYAGGTTDHRLTDIRYAYTNKNVTSTYGASIQFAYETRADASSGYLVGYEIKNTLRLKKISVFNGSAMTASLARVYNVGYEPVNLSSPYNSFVSRVGSIQECADNTLNNCYPATTFKWSKPEENISFTHDFGATNLLGATLTDYKFMDVNGNGMQDIVWANFGGGSWSVSYALDIGAKSGFNNGNSILQFSDSSAKNPPKFLPIDYNADGRQDLLVYARDLDGSNPKWRLYLSTIGGNDGWNLVLQADNVIGALPFATIKALKIADINSDGLVEAVAFNNFNAQEPGLNIYHLNGRFNSDGVVADSSNIYYQFADYTVRRIVNNPSDGLTPDTEEDDGLIFSDFNADGKMDVAVKYKGKNNIYAISSYKIFVANQNYQFEYYATIDEAGGAYGHLTSKVVAGDINGDGLADVAYLQENNSCVPGARNGCVTPDAGRWYYRLNNGVGFNAAVLIQNAPEEASFADINHDGNLDLVTTKKVDSQYKNLLVNYWSAQTGGFKDAVVFFPSVLKDTNYQFIDTNGDGWLDSLKFEKQSSVNRLSVSGHSHSYLSGATIGIVTSDQIQSITDGIGNETAISYEPLSRSSHYSPIGGIKITGTGYQKCHGVITNPNGPNTPSKPAGCEAAISYDVDTSTFYRQINNPFAALIESGELKTADRMYIPVLEVLGPVTLVTSVESTLYAGSETAPQNIQQVKNRLDYAYKNMRMQAAGRGMLGFESLSTTDVQTGITTETFYRQDWPYIGSPIRTIVQTNKGKLLSRATNTWDRRVVNGAGEKANRYQPFLKRSVTETFSLNSDGSGTILNTDGSLTGSAAVQTITTDTQMSSDDYGNVDLLTVTTSGGEDTLVKVTDNEFTGTDWEQRLGRLTSTNVTATRNGQPDTDRTVAFTYYPQNSAQNGLLWKEKVEESTNEALTTEYIYDGWGNKTQIKVTGLAEADRTETRTTTNVYDSDGRYLTSTVNDENQSSTISERNPATGQPTQVNDINEVAARVYFDSMGKEYLRVDATGAWSRTDTYICTSSCPAGGKFYTVNRVAGGGEGVSYFDSQGRVLRSSKISFDGRTIHVDIEYDKLGRTLRQSIPFFDGESAAGWTTNEYDILGRVTKVTLPDGSFSTSAHAGSVTTVTNNLGQSRSEQHNGLGKLVQVTDNLSGTISYSYNTNGNLITASTTEPNRTNPIVVRMCYDRLGRKIGMLDPDKGGWLATNTECSALSSGPATGWWKYSYNAFGELVSQRDAKNQVTTMKYDKLGRMIKRVDEEQTRWFYDKTIDGVSSVGSKGKLMAVVVRKDSSEITNCVGTDNCTQYYYDRYARPTDTLVLYPNDSTGYVTSIKYDSIGRAYETRDALNGAVFNDSGVQTQYNQYGYAYRSIDVAPIGGGKGVLSEIKTVNARGQVTEEWRNNSNFVTKNKYYPLTGLLESQKAGTSLSNMLGTMQIQDETYTWDTLGNLETRTNKNANVGSTTNKNLTETFYYDGLNRLIRSSGSGRVTQASTCNSNAQDISYDGLGNITCKNGTGTYAYGVNAGPHAVTSTLLGGVTTSYQYDTNGNMISDGSRNLTYTAYDMVKTISKGGSNSTSFSYGADHARWQRIDDKNNVRITTTYLGNVERIHRFGSSEVEWRRSVGGAIFTFKTNTNNQLLNSGNNTAFVFNDHLGSVGVIADAMGKVTHSMSFDPWGARRNGDNWGSLSASDRKAALQIGTGLVFREPITQRGFTGHEMVDEMDVVHMNGRIYDSKLGRFLQADSIIDGVKNTQGYNRYSYVHNNPLNATDPTGFSAWTSLTKALKPFVSAIVTIGLSMTGVGMVFAGMIGGGIGAAVNNGNILQGMVFGAFSGLAGGVNGWQGFMARGIVGGMQGSMSGGQFGSSFLAAGIGGLNGGADPGMGAFIQSAILGGIASELTGGKFKNGAASAAFMYAVSTGMRKVFAGKILAVRDDRGAVAKLYDHHTKFDETQEGQLSAGADVLATKLQERLDALNSNDHDSAKLMEMFGDASPATQNIIKGYITKALGVLDSLSVKDFVEGTDCYCKEAYSNSTQMFVIGRDLPIYVNPSVFSYDALTIGRFLIHELSHLSVVGSTKDYIYGYENSLRTAREEPRAAIANADNFSFYVTGLKK